VIQTEWHTIDSAPRCIGNAGRERGDNGRRPVIVTRWPIKSLAHPPMAIARLTERGWITGESKNKLWFEPTHWTPLPAPPQDNTP
jgi:hypothetical protein